MARGKLKAQARRPKKDAQSAGQPVQLPPPERSPQRAAWLLGRSFNELQHRLQVDRLTGADPDAERADVLWELVSDLFVDLDGTSDREDLRRQIKRLQEDWREVQASLEMSERRAEINRIVNGEQAPFEQEDVGQLLADLANEAVEYLQALRQRLVSVCGDDVLYFEIGELADQLLHPPITREAVTWPDDGDKSDRESSNPTAPQVRDNDAAGDLSWAMWAGASHRRVSQWLIPSGTPVAVPSWPDATWCTRMTLLLGRVDPDFAEIVRGERDDDDRRRLFAEVEAAMTRGDQPSTDHDSEAEAGAEDADDDDEDADDDDDVQLREPFLGIRFNGNRVSRRGKEVTLRTELGLAILQGFVSRRGATLDSSEMASAWLNLRHEAPSDTTMSSQRTRLNTAIRPLGIQIVSAGKNLGWYLKLRDPQGEADT